MHITYKKWFHLKMSRFKQLAYYLLYSFPPTSSKLLNKCRQQYTAHRGGLTFNILKDSTSYEFEQKVIYKVVFTTSTFNIRRALLNI